MRDKQIEIKSHDSKNIAQALKQLSGVAVYVGIPKGNNARSDTTFTNSEIGYIQEYGSPASNIPSRPFLRTGVKEAQEAIAKHLTNSAKKAYKGDVKGALANCERAGLTAQNAVKLSLRDGNWEPLSPSTIANRHKQRRTKSKREEEVFQDQSLIKPLINTGQLLNSISYVVEGK